MERLPGPDFPTGGVVVEPRASLIETYRSGRGGIRLRAAWEREELGRGTWQIVVTEIPFQVAKGKLVERIAELVNEKKLPALADVRDESAEDIRLVLEPRARTVDPAALMEALFRQTDLEVRYPVNMNVLIDGQVPKVCGLPALLRAWLDHRRDVLLRRSRRRLDRIAARVEVLDGFIVAFLNLDRVIAIIRAEDEPKPVLIAEFALSDVQAEAILNMRLRNLRRLEEMELRRERDGLLAEAGELRGLLDGEDRQWARIAEEVRAVRDRFGAGAPFRGVTEAGAIAELKRRHGSAYPPGARRTGLGDAPPPAALAEAAVAMVEREPVTVVLSRMGWIRAMKGHVGPETELKFKDGDGPHFALHAETTDRLILAASDGRFFTLRADLLPGGRGTGEPLRLMVDIANEAGAVALLVQRPGGRLLLASSEGDGFLVPEDEVIAQTRAGKQVMNLAGAARLRVCRRFAGDHVAVTGEGRKMLVFPTDELPEMAKGKGVRLQKYKDGGLADAIGITLAEGLSWAEQGGRTRREADLAEWLGKRATAGRTVPRGFPRDGRFAP
jgi:topoisomerase-4 subunit A